MPATEAQTIQDQFKKFKGDHSPDMIPLGSLGGSHSMVADVKFTNGNQIISGGPGTV